MKWLILLLDKLEIPEDVEVEDIRQYLLRDLVGMGYT